MPTYRPIVKEKSLAGIRQNKYVPTFRRHTSDDASVGTLLSKKRSLLTVALGQDLYHDIFVVHPALWIVSL